VQTPFDFHPFKKPSAMKRTFELQSKPLMPSLRWGRLFSKTALWVSTEIVLGIVGADTLADYSQFLTQNQGVVQAAEAFSNLITTI
jgi:hypothetical protein